MLSERDILAAMTTSGRPRAAADREVSRASEAPEVPEGARLSSAQRAQIDRVLKQVGGNKTEAARILGISRRSLYRWIDRLDLVDPTPPQKD